MEDIVQEVVNRTGISEDNARKAVQVVVGQLEQRLPEPMGSQVKKHLSGKSAGDSAGGSSLGDAAKSAGSMFNK